MLNLPQIWVLTMVDDISVFKSLHCLCANYIENDHIKLAFVLLPFCSLLFLCVLTKKTIN